MAGVLRGASETIDRLNLAGAAAWLKRAIGLLAGLGVAARAVTILPVGAFLIVAAIEFDPKRARGLDGELADLAGNPWGRVLLFVIAAGLAVFSAFTFVEARYRNPERT